MLLKTMMLLIKNYQSAAGSLILSIATRPDIAFTVSSMSKYCARTTKQHWTAVKRIMRYLKGTLNCGLCYKRPELKQCAGFSDADWAGDPGDHKSTSGYLFQISGATVSWRSKKQTCRTVNCWNGIYSTSKCSTGSSLDSTADNWYAKWSNWSNSDLRGQSVCYLYGQKPAVSWQSKAHRHQISFHSRSVWKRSHWTEVLLFCGYDCWHTIQYNTIQWFVTRTKSRIERRIWGAGSRWAGEGVDVG